MYNGLPTKDETSETTVLKLFGIFLICLLNHLEPHVQGRRLYSSFK